MTFACVAALLWPLNSLYSIGYMRQPGTTSDPVLYLFRHRHRQYHRHRLRRQSADPVYLLRGANPFDPIRWSPTRALRKPSKPAGCISASWSVPRSAFCCWPSFGPGCRRYFGVRAGRDFGGKIDGPLVNVLLALYMFGIGKAALMPFHRWLPAAMVAPTPVSALLHAVAVVKAGVFSVLKVIVYVFGIDFLKDTGASSWLMWVAALTVLLASFVALTKDNLKARLAYSTVSQLGYVVLGAALATSMGVIGGSMQIVMHAFGKITLFFCAGAIYTAAHKTEVSQLDGLGRAMPLTFGAFLIGALSIIGLPPLGGSWSKWYLLVGAADAEQWALMAVLLLSSLLNVAYLLPVPARGFSRRLRRRLTKSQSAKLTGLRGALVSDCPRLFVVVFPGRFPVRAARADYRSLRGLHDRSIARRRPPRKNIGWMSRVMDQFFLQLGRDLHRAAAWRFAVSQARDLRFRELVRLCPGTASFAASPWCC